MAAELSTVAVLSLSAPAAVIAAQGTVTAAAWMLWLACSLYFASSVYYVKMLLCRARQCSPGERTPWSCARGVISYHILLVALLVAYAAVWRPPVLGAAAIATAYVPALVRAFAAWIRPWQGMPSLKRVGLWEIAYAVCFAVLVCGGIAAAQVVSPLPDVN